MTKISSQVELLGAGVDQANDLLPIVDMSETGAARNKKIKVTQLLGLITDLVGMLQLKGSTDCSANPNYPAASLGDTYRVSVAGKIGGASGKDVEVGDLYYALADNAGGDETAVGTSWDVIQGNSISSSLAVEDEGVSEATGVSVLNFVGAGVTATDAGGGQVDITIPGGGGGIDVEDEGVSEATGATTLNFVGAGVTAADAGGGVVDVTIPGGSSGIDVEEEGVSEATGATTLNFTGAGVTATDAGGGQVDIDIPGSTGGMRGPWDHIQSLAPSAVASVDSEAWAGLGYRVIKAVFRLTVSSDGSGLSARYKHNGSYKSASYKSVSLQYTSSSAAANGIAYTTGILLSGTGATWGIGNATLEHIAGELLVYDPDDTAKPKASNFRSCHGVPSGSYVAVHGGGTYDSTDYNTTLDGLQFIIDAGTMSGVIDIYGLRDETGGSLTIQEEGVNEATGVTTLNFTGAGVTAADAGGGQVDITIPGGSQWQLQWGPLVNQPPAANYATLDTRNGHPVLDFDATTQEAAVFTGVLPDDYAGGGITVSIWCALTSAVTGTVGWLVSIERIDASSLDIDSDSFAAAQTVTAATVPGTSGQVLKMSVNISNGANMDSLAAGELFRIKIERDVANDTATGDAELLYVMMVEQ